MKRLPRFWRLPKEERRLPAKSIPLLIYRLVNAEFDHSEPFVDLTKLQSLSKQ
jgi:hypothetical protein